MTVASATAAWAVLSRDVARFKTLDAFAQGLSTVQTACVDPTDEKQLGDAEPRAVPPLAAGA